MDSIEELETSKQLCVTALKASYQKYETLNSILDFLTRVCGLVEGEGKTAERNEAPEVSETESRKKGRKMIIRKIKLRRGRRQLKVMGYKLGIILGIDQGEHEKRNVSKEEQGLETGKTDVKEGKYQIAAVEVPIAKTGQDIGR